MNPAPLPAEVDAAFARFRGLIAGATLLMVGLSWPLWVGGGDADAFPAVPFVAGWPRPARPLAWALGAALAGSLGAVALGRGGRWAWGASLVAFAALIPGDQGRLQPWAQQYLVVGLGAACLPRPRALGLARWYAVVLYAASGLSKLDAAFVDELGGTFLRTIGHLVGLDPGRWAAAPRAAATLAMPLGELAVAVALAVPRWRGWGLAGSVAQHLATIAILGPWALDHSANVLAWNGAVLLENCVLFAPRRAAGEALDPRAGLVAGCVVVALVGLERWGWVDSWPAHALYASHAERAAILWPADEADALPASARRWLGPADADGFGRLDLAAWSRAARGVPVYPQNRVACGIAEALTGPAGVPARVILWGRAGIARKPPRDRAEAVGRAAIRRRGGRYRINAHPAAPPGPARG